MNKPTTLEEVFEKAPILKDWLRQTIWPPITSMIIPSVLKSADEFIDFLKDFESKEAKELREELINLRVNFRRDPPETWVADNSNAKVISDYDLGEELDRIIEEKED